MKSSMWRQGIALGPCLVVFSSWHTTHPSKYHAFSFITAVWYHKNSRWGAFWSHLGHAKMWIGKDWSKRTCQNIIWMSTAVAKHCSFKCFDGDLGHVQWPLKSSYYISLHSWTWSCKVLTFKALKLTILISNLLVGW